MKTVSVVMCTYNGAPYLRQQLDTIINQTYPIHELIVQDDQSTDDTMAILEEYAARYPFMQIHRKQQRRGINDNFFTAMAYATGDYIALSDQDDIWELTKIEEQINAIGDNWICCHPSPSFKNNVFPSPNMLDMRVPNYCLERMFFANNLMGHTMLFRHDFFDKVRDKIPASLLPQLFDNLFYDTIFAVVANAYGKIRYLNSILTWHRRLEYSATLGEKRKDISKRTWTNALRLVLRNMDLKRRREITPLIHKRLHAIVLLLDCFPDAPCTKGVRKLIDAYFCGKWYGGVLFLRELVKNRNKIFYAPEKNQFIATLRALLMPITMYDTYSIAYRYKKEGRPDA